MENFQFTTTGNNSTISVCPISNLTNGLNHNTNRFKEKPSLSRVANDLKCRTCLDVIGTQRYYILMAMGDLTKTVKEMIIFCIPQMASTLFNNDVVCKKCFEAIKFCVKFIESCLEVEKKIKNLNRKEKNGKYVHLGNKNLSDTIEYVNKDHDYIIKIDPDDSDNSQCVDMQPSRVENLPENHLPTSSNSVENCTNSNQQILTNPNNISVPQIWLANPIGLLQGNLMAGVGNVVTENKQKVLTEVNSNKMVNLRPEEFVQIPDRDRLKCPNCGKFFRNETYVLNHMRKVHCTDGPTEENNEEVSSESERLCFSSSNEKKSNGTPNCQKKFDIKEEYQEPDPAVNCPFCDDDVKITEMESHLKEHNAGQPEISQSQERKQQSKKPFKKCRFCSESWIGNKSNHKPNCPNKLKINDPILKCPFCKGRFRITQMESHLRDQHNEVQAYIIPPQKKGKLRKKPITKCRVCAERFTSAEDLRVHLKTHPPLICELCGKQYFILSSLRAHQANHNDPESFICEICGEGFRKRCSLNFHLQIHENKKFNCEKCPKVFRTLRHLTHHVNYVHSQVNRGQCSQCGVTLKDKCSLKEHIRLVHLKLKPFRCEICDKKFGRADYLRKHRVMHDKEQNREDGSNRKRRKRWVLKAPGNSSSGKLLPCKFCGKWVEGIPKLKIHLRTHIRRFPCRFCSLSFATKQYCNRHELVHTDSENFLRCNVCWKTFNSEEELEEHTEVKHNNPKHPCSVCGKMFYTIFLLNNHNLLEHTGTDDAEKAKQMINESLLEVTESNET